MRSASPHGSGRTHSECRAGVWPWRVEECQRKQSSWRRETEKCYSLAWGLWQGWCSKHIDPLSASLSEIANFLLNVRMVNGAPHSTPHIISAISAILTPQSGLAPMQHPAWSQMSHTIYPVGQHLIVFKGCSMNAPLSQSTRMSCS